MKLPSKKVAVAGAVAAVLVLAGGGICVLDLKRTAPQQASESASDTEGGHLIKDGRVYYRTYEWSGDSLQPEDQEVKDADAHSFTSINSYWGRDKNNLFYFEEVVRPAEGTSQADLASFVFLDKSSSLGKDNRAVYIITPSPDKEKWVYKVIPGADASTFETIELGPYAKDKLHAYFIDYDGVRKIEGVDGSTFTVLSECAAVEKSTGYYAADANSIIVGDQVMPEINRDTFRVEVTYNTAEGMYAMSSYAVDKNRVYKGCGEVTQGNPQTCSFFNLKECE